MAGQEFSLGVVGGLHLNDDFRSRPDIAAAMREPATSVFISRKSSSFTPRIGPKVEIDFTNRWSLETEILFHRPVWTVNVNYDPPIQVRPDGPLVSEQIERFDELIVEIPVLAKRQVAWGRAKVVFEVGPSFLPFGGFDSPGKIGVTAGVGTRFAIGPVQLQPTVRYSRWPRTPEEASAGFGGLPFRRDMVSLLLGADIRSTSLGTADRPSELLSIGFIGGTTLTKGFPDKNGFTGATSRMAGVAFEYLWSERWGVEADVLYHPLILSERARATVLTWELPVLAKRRFGAGPVRPVFFGGPSFRLSGNRNSSNPSGVGVTAGGGIEYRHGRFSVSPALRYVRWARDAPAELSPGSINQNQLQALVTIRFGGR